MKRYRLPNNPFNVESIADDCVPYVEDGQIVWKAGWIEYTTTFEQPFGACYKTTKPNAVGHGGWKKLQLDNELYFGKLHRLRLKATQTVWWRAAPPEEEKRKRPTTASQLLAEWRKEDPKTTKTLTDACLALCARKDGEMES